MPHSPFVWPPVPKPELTALPATPLNTSQLSRRLLLNAEPCLKKLFSLVQLLVRTTNGDRGLEMAGMRGASMYVYFIKLTDTFDRAYTGDRVRPLTFIAWYNPARRR